MTDTLPSLTELVDALPEVYQPIHGHPELSRDVSRLCEDRLTHILAVHDSLRALFGRPLRVLDLGCAQGYFSLHLAERGAQVTGIDYLPENIAVCRVLAAERPELRLSFDVGRIEDVLQAGLVAYDLVLGLSVLHHLAHEHGVDRVRHWLAAAKRIDAVFVLELALASEPLYWAPALPDDPAELIADFAFKHELARNPTHLSDIERPLFVASDRYWLLPPLAGEIDAHFTDPHALAPAYYQGSRHYYISGQRFIKLFRYDADPALDNAGELAREAHFLRSPPSGLRLPALLAQGESAHEGWLVREHLPGRLLLDRLAQTPAPPAVPLLRAILESLTCLEQAGLYHSDLRVWNLLCLENDAPDVQVVLLDYGSILETAVDRAWPHDIFLSFIILVHEIVTGQVARPQPLRTVTIGPWSLPSPYREWIETLWGLPREHWRFQILLDRFAILADDASAQTGPVGVSGESLWRRAIEHAIEIQSEHMKNLYWERTETARFQALEHEHARLQAWSQELEQTLADKDDRIAQLECLVSHLEAETEAAEARAIATEARIRALLNSLSWRLTAPLRALAGWLSGLNFGRVRAAPRATLFWLARQVLARPWAAALGWRLLRRLPRLHLYLSRTLLVATPAKETPWPAETAQITRLRRALHAATRPLD